MDYVRESPAIHNTDGLLVLLNFWWTDLVNLRPMAEGYCHHLRAMYGIIHLFEEPSPYLQDMQNLKVIHPIKEKM